jgi:hypothetical protein
MEKLTEAEATFYRTWIYAGSCAVFDLATVSKIDGCGIYLDVAFHPLGVQHKFGHRRGVTPDLLVMRVSELTGIRFSKDGDVFSLASDDPPFDDAVISASLVPTVAILKAIYAIGNKQSSTAV